MSFINDINLSQESVKQKKLKPESEALQQISLFIAAVFLTKMKMA